MRTFLINFLLPLVVTVGGGVAIYHYPEISQKRFGTTLTVSEPESFGFGDSSITKFEVELKNQFPHPVEDLQLTLNFSFPLSELKIAKDNDHVAHSKPIIGRSNSDYTVEIPSLRSKESVEFQFFAAGVAKQNFPTVSATARDFVVVKVEKSWWQKQGSGQQIRLVSVISGAIAALVISMLLRQWAGKASDRTKKHFRNRPFPNNTAFVLLHLGKTEIAKEILERVVRNEGATTYELSNLALCEALLGHAASADTFLTAAEFLISDGDYPIIVFNKGLVAFLQGDFKTATTLLNQFRDKEADDFDHYRDYSVILQHAVKDLKLE